MLAGPTSGVHKAGRTPAPPEAAARLAVKRQTMIPQAAAREAVLARRPMAPQPRSWGATARMASRALAGPAGKPHSRPGRLPATRILL